MAMKQQCSLLHTVPTHIIQGLPKLPRDVHLVRDYDGLEAPPRHTRSTSTRHTADTGIKRQPCRLCVIRCRSHAQALPGCLLCWGICMGCNCQTRLLPLAFMLCLAAAGRFVRCQAAASPWVVDQPSCFHACQPAQRLPFRLFQDGRLGQAEWEVFRLGWVCRRPQGSSGRAGRAAGHHGRAGGPHSVRGRHLHSDSACHHQQLRQV